MKHNAAALKGSAHYPPPPPTQPSESLISHQPYTGMDERGMEESGEKAMADGGRVGLGFKAASARISPCDVESAAIAIDTNGNLRFRQSDRQPTRWLFCFAGMSCGEAVWLPCSSGRFCGSTATAVSGQ